MTNDMVGGIFLGIGLSVIILAVFQVGLNIGIKQSMQLLDGEYPAAFKFLQKNKPVGKLLPYVIGGNNE